MTNGVCNHKYSVNVLKVLDCMTLVVEHMESFWLASLCWLLLQAGWLPSHTFVPLHLFLFGVQMALAVLFVIAKNWKQPKYPQTDKQTNNGMPVEQHT